MDDEELISFGEGASSMARLRRYFASDQPQHVIQRGNNREPIFAAHDDYRFFRACLVEAASRHGVAIHAEVLMTNHVHILATPEPTESPPKTMHLDAHRN